MVCGMVLAGLAFLIAGFVQLRVEVGTTHKTAYYAQSYIHTLQIKKSPATLIQLHLPSKPALEHLCTTQVLRVKSSWGKTSILWEAVSCLTGEDVGTLRPLPSGWLAYTSPVNTRCPLMLKVGWAQRRSQNLGHQGLSPGINN